MNKTVATATGLILTLVGAVPADVLPGVDIPTMTQQYAYSVDTDMVNKLAIPPSVDEKGVYHAKEIVPRETPLSFKDDGSGTIYFSVLRDWKGNEVFVQIDSEQYAKMGRPSDGVNGSYANVKKEEYVPLIEYLATPEKAVAAVAFDKTFDPAQVSAASLTYNHQVTSTTTNPIFIVGCLYDSTLPITSITYNGVATTESDAIENIVGQWTTLRGLDAPATGDNNVVFTYGSGSSFINCISASYTGTAQSGWPDAHAENSTAGTSLTCTLTTVADNAGMVMLARSNTGTISASTNSTARADSKGGLKFFEHSSQPLTPAGSNSMTFTNGAATLSALCASFGPFVPVTAVADSSVPILF